MKIAFFSESNFEGKIQRDFDNMRTEYAWYVALDSTHHWMGNLPNLQDNMYDLGMVIIPKNNIENLMKFPMVEQMKRVCKKIGFMQEGPAWYFQDYPMNQQIWFYNCLMEMDVIFSHNQSDVKYFKGLTQKEHVYQNKSLMITDNLKKSKAKNSNVMIGGNMVRWYGGFDSYIIAQEFNKWDEESTKIYAPSMGRKIELEDQMENLIHLPYMTWVDWVNYLSQFKYAVHLMPTHAAGTFALNCAYWGIPCIGYGGLDTQEELHPHCTVRNSNLEDAREIAMRLVKNQDFYEQCSKEAIESYKLNYDENIYINSMKQIFNQLLEK
tara:strand:+ start:735 stop:1706 length:972 start_codon:yes stop_codon:yes gene_type:complete